MVHLNLTAAAVFHHRGRCSCALTGVSLTCVFPGKREVSDQLLRAQSSLCVQEEAWRQAQQEKRSLGEELIRLRVGLQRAEAESRSLQVC